MRLRIQATAEGYGELAALRSGREFVNPEFTVEDALEWCIFYLWALENLEETEDADGEL